jgi:hypothetical protein
MVLAEPRLQAVNMLRVDDEEEVRYSQRIMQLFDRAAEIEAILESRLEPAAGSARSADDVRSPHHSVSDYAVGQLHVAWGCIASLKQMMVREGKGEIHMVASPFGAYALIRNSMDAAAVALWLLEPGSGTLRIKRRWPCRRDWVTGTRCARISHP